MPKPVMRSLSPQTKQHLNEVFNVEVKRAYARGDDAGWKRGFRVGVLLAFAVLSTVGLVVAGVAWVLA